MAIEGPVRELALSDLLQLLFLSRRSGNLFVRDDTGGQAVVLELEHGSLTGATGTSPETRLGHLLIGSGRATDGQVRRALGTQQVTPDRRLGEILAELGEVRAAEIQRHLRFQIEEAVFDLMRWKEGHLRFEEGEPRESGLIEVRLATDALLMDAVRRLDEWAEVTASAPNPDPLPRLAIAANGASASLSLQPLEWEVLGKVDGETSLRRIARGLGRGELEVARAIYGLATAGLVEMGSRTALSVDSGSDLMEEEIRAAEAALVEGRVGEAELRVQPLLAMRPGAAALHVLRGRILASRHEWDAAMRTFDRAIEIDPLLPTAYFHLARAAARAGDLGRAGGALGTYQRLPDNSIARRNAAEKMAAGLEQLLGGLEEVLG
jgi:tetratricopeptide (TPR) repeat protein